MRVGSAKILLGLLLCLTAAACSSAPDSKSVDSESDPEYQFKKASVAMSYGLPEQAVGYAKKALDLDPDHYRALNLLGLAYIKMEDYNSAVSAFEKCAEIKPDFADVYFNLGTMYEKLNRLEEAASSYKKAFELGGPVEAGLNLAKILYNQEKLEESLGYVEKVAEKNESVSVFNLKGVILNKMERYPEAVQAFDRAIQISPKDIVTRMNLGIALVNNRDFERARKVFEYILPFVEDQVLKDRINQYLELIKNRLT